MTRTTLGRTIAFTSCAIALAALAAAEAAAQRRGGGGAAARMGASRPTTYPGKAPSRDLQVRSRSTANVNAHRNVNVNVDRDVHVDVDHHYDYDWGDHYHPVARAAVAAAVVGTYYRTLPANCVTIYRGAIVYYQCGSVWYRPSYYGTSVQYVVVTAP